MYGGVDALFKPSAKAPIEAAVQEVESHTSAELVVTACKMAGEYRDVDYLMGAVLALITLVALLYLPTPFPLYVFPIDVALGFAIGAGVGRQIRPLRRVLAGRERLRRAAQQAAKAAFFDQEVRRTADRTGILVHIAGFERRVDVLADNGIDLRSLGEAWGRAQQELEEAVRRDDLDGFVRALKSLGPLLAPSYPRGEDDVNELPDGLMTA
jgi:putative membrane protein